MSINIIDNFSVNVAKPLDAKITASGSVARWAIPYRYDGLKVYDLSDRKTYVWNISSATWSIDHQIIIGDGYVPKYQPSLDGFTNHHQVFGTCRNLLAKFKHGRRDGG